MLAGRAFGQPKAQLPPPHPQNTRRSPHLPLAVIWYPGGAHLPLWVTSPMPALLQTWEEEGKKKKGKEESGGN